MMQTNSDHKQWNDRMVEKFNPQCYHTNSFFMIRWVEKLRRKTIKKMLHVRQTDNVLEVGCGAGNIIEEFNNCRITGLDLSFPLLLMAQKKKYRMKTAFLQSYAEYMPFRDESFEKAYCSEVLEHVENPKLVCAEINRTLKANGSFVVSVPNEKFINSIKKFIKATKINKIISKFKGYKFSENMLDEWHLHESDLTFLKGLLDGIFVIKKIRYIPCRIFPVRIVALCKKSGNK